MITNVTRTSKISEDENHYKRIIFFGACAVRVSLRDDLNKKYLPFSWEIPLKKLKIE